MSADAARRAKRWIKAAFASAMYYTGALTLYQRVALRGRAVVLMYHRVLTPEERSRSGSHPGIVVTCDTFARQMAVLKRRFRVLSLEEFTGHLEHRIPFPDSSCVITFDDGWHDNLQNALPVLRRHRLPAVIFLPVGYIGTRSMFWREALTHLIVLAGETCLRRPEMRAACVEALAPLRLEAALDADNATRRARVIDMVGETPGLTDRDVVPVLDRLAAALGVRLEDLDTPDRFVSWAQAAEMTGAGVTFGGHGRTHRLLATLPAEEVEEEVRESKRVVDAQVPARVPSFSYPNGSWNGDVAECVRAAGYRLAFTTASGFVACDDNPFALRRQNLHEDATDTEPMFVARILGLL